MASNDLDSRIKSLMNKVPVFRCPNCGETKVNQFYLNFRVPVCSEMSAIDQVEKRLIVKWNTKDISDDASTDLTSLELDCSSCSKTSPIPEGWTVEMV